MGCGASVEALGNVKQVHPVEKPKPTKQTTSRLIKDLEIAAGSIYAALLERTDLGPGDPLPVEARVWDTTHPEFQFPEFSTRPQDAPFTVVPQASLPDWLAARPVSLCFGGGGSRSVACGAGWLRALWDGGLVSRSRYVTATSGGSWVVTPFIYLPADVDEDTFLGPYVPPEQLTLAVAQARPGPQCILAGATVPLLSDLFHDIIFGRNAATDGWAMAVREAYLAPYGLGDLDSVFTWHKDGPAHDRAVARGAVETTAKVHAVVRADRPYLIITGAMDMERPRDPTNWGVPMAITPIYCGAYRRSPGIGPGGQAVGGGYVESFAYGGRAGGPKGTWLPPAASHGDSSADLPLLCHERVRMSLATAIAVSSAYPAGKLDSLGFKSTGFPRLPIFPAGDAIKASRGVSGVGVVVDHDVPHVDLGDLPEALGIIPLLQRGARKLLVFNSAAAPATADGILQDIVIPIVFGAPNPKYSPGDFEGRAGPSMRLFGRTAEEAAKYFASLQTDLQRLYDAGLPCVSGPWTYAVAPNARFAIAGGYDAQVMWVYNALDTRRVGPGSWMGSLHPSLAKAWPKLTGAMGQRSVLSPIADALFGAPPLHNFPNISCIAPNFSLRQPLAVMNLSPIQANLLSAYSAWSLKHPMVAPRLAAFFEVPLADKAESPIAAHFAAQGKRRGTPGTTADGKAVYTVSVSISAEAPLLEWSPRIMVTLVGDVGESAPTAVGDSGRCIFFPGESSRPQTITTPVGLGKLGAVRVELSETILGVGLTGRLELALITVSRGSERTIFPCYSSVAFNDPRVFLAGGAALPGGADDWMAPLRRHEIDRARRLYTWVIGAGLPGYAGTEPPHDEEFKTLKGKNLAIQELQTFGSFEVLGELRTLLEPWKLLRNIDELFSAAVALPKPAVAATWTEDAEFGRQHLQGVHPAHFRLCSDLPASLAGAHAALGAAGVLGPRGVTLAGEIAAGRIYLADYTGLADFLKPSPSFEVDAPGEARYAAPCLVLLHARPSTKELMPVAIKLDGRTPDGAIFTPADAPFDWTTAKAWALSADNPYHQIAAHYLQTHAIAEPYVIAARRCLSARHPVLQLLVPHLKYNLHINAMARKVLINKGGIIESLMSLKSHAVTGFGPYSYARWSPEDMALPASCAERGVMDKAALPDYPFRDDGLLVWGAIEEYVAAHVAAYYTSDADVAGDPELAEYYTELIEQGHPTKRDLYPAAMTTVPLLVNHLASFIWIVSAQHAAQNFPQYHSIGYVPFRPYEMRSPPPTAKDTCTEATLVASLPTKAKTLELMSVVYNLSQYAPGEQYLGQRQQNWLHDPPAQAAFARFQDRLTQVEAVIDARNKTRKVPYPYLKPSAIPSSIAI